MEIFLAAFIALGQDADLRYEDVKIIVERNIFSPAKPKKKEEPKKEEKREEKKAEAPPRPVVTGFEGYPDGFRVLVHDRAKGLSVRYGIGDALAGGTIAEIDNTRAVIRTATGTVDLRAGDSVLDSLPAAPQGADVTPPGAAQEQEEVREKMKKRLKKRVEEDSEDEETPRLKKRGNR